VRLPFRAPASLGLAAALTVSLLLAAPADAAPAAGSPGGGALPQAGAAQAAAPGPQIGLAPVGDEVRMGRYAASQFAAQAKALPPSLSAQLKAQLRITPAQFLADGQAAADASKVVAQLRADGVAVTGATMHGTSLTVSVADAGDEDAVRAVGATAAVAPAQPLSTVAGRMFTDPVDGSSPWLGGNMWLYDVSGGFIECSAGFNGYDAKSGAREFVTAGHCADYIDTGLPRPTSTTAYALTDETPDAMYSDMSPAGAIGRLQQPSFRIGGYVDSGLVSITAPAAQVLNSVGTWGATASSATAASTASQGVQAAGTAIPVVGTAAAITGAPVCHSGARTGWQCGTVTQAAGYIEYGGGLKVEGFGTDTCDLEGDSGGAFVSGNYAVGITSGGTWQPQSTTDSPGVSECDPTQPGITVAFPTVAAVSGEASIASAQPGFELGVVEPSTTPAVAKNSAGTATAVSGILTFADGVPAATGTAVKLRIDGGTAQTTKSAANGAGAQAWKFALSKVPNGTHSYTLTIGTGHSAVTLSGSFTSTGYYGGPSVRRLSGADRYQTAVAVSRDSYPSGGAKVVVVASGQNFPDALSAAPAAVKLGGPLLLTQPTALPSAVSAEIARLRPAKIVLVGGPGAVSPAVAAALARLAPTTRVYGADRYATSLAVDKYAFGSSNVPAAFIATGASFPDALSASGYAGGAGMPVVLVNGTSTGIPAALRSWLTAAKTTALDIAGGTSAVSASVAASLGAVTGHAPTRFGGADRYATSALINAQFGSASSAYLAGGTDFPDALAGAAAAGRVAAPLYLVQHDCVPGAVLSAFAKWKTATAEELGGPAALGSGVTALTRCG